MGERETRPEEIKKAEGTFQSKSSEANPLSTIEKLVEGLEGDKEKLNRVLEALGLKE